MHPRPDFLTPLNCSWSTIFLILALLCSAQAEPPSKPVRSAKPNAAEKKQPAATSTSDPTHKPITLQFQESTLEQLARSIRDQTPINLLVAEELRTLRVPEIHLTRVHPADALRSLEKIIPGMTLHVTPGPSGTDDPSTIYELLPPKKSSAPTSLVLKSGQRTRDKKGFTDFVAQAMEAVTQACSSRSKADPAHPIAPPRIDSHPQTQLLFVSGSQEAIHLANQVLVALGCELPAYQTPVPPLASIPPSLPALPTIPTLPTQNPASNRSLLPTEKSAPAKTDSTPADRLSEIQAAHAEATRQLRILEENSRTVPLKKTGPDR
jgi:hypothetical protein